MSDLKDFLREHAKEIAFALRERGNHLAATERLDEAIDDVTAVEDLYKALIFDEPLIDHIPNLSVAVSSLSRLLLRPGSGYAVSNRLVNGVVYLCKHNETLKYQESSKRGTVDDGGPDRNQGKTQIARQKQMCMCKLLFCLSVDIPLECFSDNSLSEANLKKIRLLLGSFKGDYKSQQESLFETTSDKEEEDVELRKEENETLMESRATDYDHENDTLIEEKWATESDPSDFDYAEGSDGFDMKNQECNSLMNDEDWLCPNFLSKPDENRSIQQIRDSLESLVQLASYTLLETLFSLPTKEIAQYLSKLNQLILTLIQPRGRLHCVSSTSRTPAQLKPNLLDNMVETTILSPIRVLRDVAMYQDTKSLPRSDFYYYENAYLRLLQILLGTDQAYLKDMGLHIHSKSREQSVVCLSSIVGLTSLSSWCAFKQKPNQLILDVLVDSMNDLEHVVQRGQRSHKKSIPNILTPILEILSGIYYDHIDNTNSDSNVTVSRSKVPQTMLNSGFLRQILSLTISVDKEKANSCSIESLSSSDLLGFHHALWGMCMAFPKTVGRYVFRYPGSTQLVRCEAINLENKDAQNCVQCILWNVYAWYHCEDSNGGTALSILRSHSSSQKIPTKLSQEECSCACGKAWFHLCLLVMRSLEGNFGCDSAEGVIREWGRLLVFTGNAFIASLFRCLLDQTPMDNISNTIFKLAADNDQCYSNDMSKTKGGKDKSRKKAILSAAQKSLKEYKSFFKGDAHGSSKID